MHVKMYKLMSSQPTFSLQSNDIAIVNTLLELKINELEMNVRFLTELKNLKNRLITNQS